MSGCIFQISCGYFIQAKSSMLCSIGEGYLYFDYDCSVFSSKVLADSYLFSVSKLSPIGGNLSLCDQIWEELFFQTGTLF